MLGNKKASALLLAVFVMAAMFTGCIKEGGSKQTSSSGKASSGLSSAESDITSGDEGSVPADSSDKNGSGTTGSGSSKSSASRVSSTSAPSGPAAEWLKGKTIEIRLGVYDAGKEASTSSGKYAIQQREAIEKKYKCKLLVKTIDYNTFLPRLMIGDAQGADIVDSSGPHYLKAALANDLYTQLDGLVDLNQSSMNKTYIEGLKSNGKHYVAVPQRYGFEYIGENMVMWFNKRLVKNAGYDPDSLYAMWKNGTWTWDKMEEIAKKIHDEPSQTFGIGNGYGDNFQWMSLLLSNGANLIDTENGKQVFNISSAKSMEALTFWQKNAKYMSVGKAATQDALFIQGKVGFLSQYVNRLQYSNFAKMKDDFGIIPLPKGPSANRYYSPVSYIWGYAIPTAALTNDDKNQTKAKALAIIIDELSKPAIPQDVMNRVKNVMYESIVRDKGSYDVLQAIDSGAISVFSNYYFAITQAQSFDEVMRQVAAGLQDINTAVQQNKERLSQEYRDSVKLGS